MQVLIVTVLCISVQVTLEIQENMQRKILLATIRLLHIRYKMLTWIYNKTTLFSTVLVKPTWEVWMISTSTHLSLLACQISEMRDSIHIPWWLTVQVQILLSWHKLHSILLLLVLSNTTNICIGNLNSKNLTNQSNSNY